MDKPLTIHLSLKVFLLWIGAPSLHPKFFVKKKLPNQSLKTLFVFGEIYFAKCQVSYGVFPRI